MKKTLVLALAMTLLFALLPSAFAEENVREELPVYVWIQDMGIDFDALIAQIPAMDEVDRLTPDDFRGYRFPYSLNGGSGEGLVWYDEDGGVDQAQFADVVADGRVLDSLGLYVNGGMATYTVSAGEDMLVVHYSASGRMMGYTYFANGSAADFDSFGELTAGYEKEYGTVARHGLPQVIGDVYDPRDLGGFAPDVAVYAALQDAALGVDLAEVYASIPPRDEFDNTNVYEDGRGFMVGVQWDENGAVRSFALFRPAPVAGDWYQAVVDLEARQIALTYVEPTHILMYSLSGELELYIYQALDGTAAVFHADGAPGEYEVDGMRLATPTDDPARLALYPPLTVIPPSRDYAAEPVIPLP